MAVQDTVFTYGPGNITSLLATTLPAHSKQMADNIFTAIPLFAILAEKNQIIEAGGSTLVRPVMYAKNSTAASYASDDVLDTTIQDPFTAAQFQWRQYAASISLPGRIEAIQNTGQQEVIDITMALMQHAELSIKDKLDIDLFKTSQTGTAITPLPAIISGTGTTGDINGGTNSWWQATSISSGSFSARGLSDLRSAFNQTVLKNPVGPVDAILSDRASFEAYESTIVPSLRIMDTNLADLGFENFKYKNATWTFDLNAPAGTIYGINTKTIQLVTHTNRRFVLSDWVKPAGQDLKVAQIFWAGELTTNNRRKNFILTGVTA